MKYFTISILLSSVFFGCSVNKKVDNVTPQETFVQPDNSESPLTLQEILVKLDSSKRAIWKIMLNFERSLITPDSDKERVVNGTGFFIGTNHFITNFHIIDNLLNKDNRPGVLENKNIIDYIVLSQKGRASVLRVKKILAVSALHDLALLETEESVENYLSLREDMPESNEIFFLPASYPGGVFREIIKTGHIIYEDDLSYSFPINRSYLEGTSGSPVLDVRGQVVGVTFSGLENLLHAIKINHLKEFIMGNAGMKCSDLKSSGVKDCIKEEMEDLEGLAEEGSAYAQYHLALMYYNNEGTPQNFNRIFYWLEKAAERGYAPAQYRLARLNYVYEDNERFYDWTDSPHQMASLQHSLELLVKAAEQGYVPAQYELALIELFHYREREGFVDPAYLQQALGWLKIIAKQGYAPAQYQLAYMYYSGREGIDQDIKQAVYWLKKSARRGYAPAQNHLAFMYYQGEGVNQDIKRAVYWLKKATEQGYSPFQYWG